MCMNIYIDTCTHVCIDMCADMCADMCMGHRCQIPCRLPCYNCIGHYYIGHNYIGHNYLGHNCIGHNYIGHNYIGAKYPAVAPSWEMYRCQTLSNLSSLSGLSNSVKTELSACFQRLLLSQFACGGRRPQVHGGGQLDDSTWAITI